MPVPALLLVHLSGVIHLFLKQEWVTMRAGNSAWNYYCSPHTAEADSLNYGAHLPFKSDGIFVKTTECTHLQGAILWCELLDSEIKWVQQLSPRKTCNQFIHATSQACWACDASVLPQCQKYYAKESKRRKPKCEPSKQCFVYIRWVTQECPCLQSDWLDISRRKILLWSLTFRSPALSSCEMRVVSPRHPSVEFSCPVCPHLCCYSQVEDSERGVLVMLVLLGRIATPLCFVIYLSWC